MGQGIDIVIPLGTGSRWQDNELRYALRSIEKNLTGYRNVYIVGAPRRWLQNVIYIEAKENYTRKERCIFDKIVLACEHPDVSESFFFTNDDIFVLKPIDVSAVKYWKNQTVKNLMIQCQGTYRITVANTEKHLRTQGLPDGNFDIHVPIVYEKDKFLQLLQVDWSSDHIIKSLYCNTHHIKGEDMRELKFSKTFLEPEILKAIEGRLFFSINEHAVNQPMMDVLQKLFPFPSKYEKH